MNLRQGTRQVGPVTSGEGVPPPSNTSYGVLEGEVAVKGLSRLFNKNTGLCQLVRGGIGADACPVPEG